MNCITTLVKPLMCALTTTTDADLTVIEFNSLQNLQERSKYAFYYVFRFAEYTHKKINTNFNLALHNLNHLNHYNCHRLKGHRIEFTPKFARMEVCPLLGYGMHSSKKQKIFTENLQNSLV